MKKVILLLSSFFILPAFASVDFWVSDINANNGHVTYTLNVILPSSTPDGEALHMRNRRDYICSQNKEATLWGEAIYLSTGKTVDYTSIIDKKKLRKYVPVEKEDYDIVQKIIPYCNN